jgi:cobalt-precorrin-5B (C1)-methyltransferase
VAGVIKDAGDDPDVTHGAEIIAQVAEAPPGSGLIFRAGEGVGMVTLPGLPIAVGEPAINPGPRRQIAENLGGPDAVITLSIPGGAELAAKTLNARLGIVGGLSILGTTGIVRPYSCSAWVHSIHRGIDVARALGLDHVVATTGKTSEATARQILGVCDQALIDMGDMAGAVLKYLRRAPVARLTLVGGFGKLAKLAAGQLDLHSNASQVDLAFLAGLVEELGGKVPPGTAVSAAQMLALAGDLPLGDLVARRAREVALAVLSGGTQVSVMAIDRAGNVVGQSG